MRSPSDSERLALDGACAPEAVQPLSLTERLLRRRLMDQLAQLQGGRLLIDDALGSVELGASPAPDAAPSRPLRLHVRNPAFYRAMAANGSVGAAKPMATAIGIATTWSA